MMREDERVVRERSAHSNLNISMTLAEWMAETESRSVASLGGIGKFDLTRDARISAPVGEGTKSRCLVRS